MYFTALYRIVKDPNDPQYALKESSLRMKMFSLSSAVIWILVCGIATPTLAQIGKAPSADDVTPSVNAEVSDTITTDGGQGYSSWSGSVRRTCVDMEIPGAVSSHGLKCTR